MKKALIFAMILSAQVSHAAQCTESVTQFVGKVKGIERVSDTQCRIKLSKNTRYQQAGVCGLTDVLIEQNGLLTDDCTLKVDQPLGGVAAVKEGATEQDIYLEK